MVDTEPDMVDETLVYHCGKKRYITAIKRRIGMLNNAAIGRPDVSLTENFFCVLLTLSQ